MYRFIIKGINGVIKYTSSTSVARVSVAQIVGNRFKKCFIRDKQHNIVDSDTVEVINVGINVSLTKQQPNYLLVQQY